MPGCLDALRARSLDAPPAPCCSGRWPSPSRISPAPPTRGSSALCPRPRLSRSDRILWVWLSRAWVGWRSSLAIVQPATVLTWHRRGFQLYWRWKSSAKLVGRPKLDPEVRHLIRRMARENPTWGRRRIRAELALLGYDGRRADRRQVHAPDVASALAHVARLSRRSCPRHRRRRLLPRSHPHLPPPLRLRRAPPSTAASSSTSTSRITPPRSGRPGRSSRRSRTIRLQGSCFVIETRSTARSSRGESRGMGIREVLIAPRAPWQNPFVERVIGSIRRECLDHCLILNEAHLRRLLRGYIAYYNTARPHQSLDNNSPQPRDGRTPDLVAGSSPSRRSVGSITATSAPPDHRDRDTLLWLRLPPRSRLRPAPLAALHIFVAKMLSGPWTVEPSVEPPRHWRR